MSRFEYIGHTPLIPLTELAGEPLTATVLIKDESANPTGTHKDRKSAWLIQRALEKNVDTLAILTAGNAGYSLATLAEGTGLRIVTIVSQTIRPSIRKTLETTCAEIQVVDLSQPLNSDAIIELARNKGDEKIWDVTNGGHDAYRQLYDEVSSERPDMIICPMGSGELYLGLCDEIDEREEGTIVLGVHPALPRSKADKLCTEYLPLRDNMLMAQLRHAKQRFIGHAKRFIVEDEIDWCIENKPNFLNAEPSALVPLTMIHSLRDSRMKIIMISTGKGKVEEAGQ